MQVALHKEDLLFCKVFKSLSRLEALIDMFPYMEKWRKTTLYLLPAPVARTPSLPSGYTRLKSRKPSVIFAGNERLNACSKV